MKSINKTICNGFFESLNNAYGSRYNFEKELIYRAYQLGNRGKLYFKINNLLNFNLSSNSNEDNHYTLLTCNLDQCDIFNFIEDIDYTKLSNAYVKIKELIQTKQVVRI